MMNNSSQSSARRALRRRRTTAEKTLWAKLRSRSLAGYKFKWQVSIDQYVVDFYCADQRRQRDLELRGFTVLRFSNSQVKNSIGTVLNTIVEQLERR